MQSTREALPIYVIGKAYQFLARMRLFIKNKVLKFLIYLLWIVMSIVALEST